LINITRCANVRGNGGTKNNSGQNIMRKIKLTLFVTCATLLWVGAAYAQRFIDNGDGTITDTTTNLLWEKKTGNVDYGRRPITDRPLGRRCPGDPGCADVHDVNNLYTWGNNLDRPPSGGAFTDFLDSLNGRSTNATTVTPDSCFARRCSWRLPSVEELQGISTFPCARLVCIDPIFGSTFPSYYWSAVNYPNPTYSFSPDSPAPDAYALDFGNNQDPDRSGPVSELLPMEAYVSVRAVADPAEADRVPDCTPVAYLFRHAEEKDSSATNIYENTLLPVGNRHAALYQSMIKRFQSKFNYCPVSTVFAMARKNAPNGPGLPEIAFPNGLGTTNPFFTAKPLDNAAIVAFQEPYPTVYDPITSTVGAIETPGVPQDQKFGLLYEYLSYPLTRQQLLDQIAASVGSKRSVAVFWSSQGMGEVAKVLGQPIPAYKDNHIPSVMGDYKAPRNSVFVFSNYNGNTHTFNKISVPAMVRKDLMTGQFIQCFNYAPEDGGSFDSRTFFCRYDGSLNYKTEGLTPIPDGSLDKLEGAICNVDMLAPYGNPGVYIGIGVIDNACF
jgi:hypothetical protein